MRKIAVSLIAIVVFTATIFAGDGYTKNLNIEPNSSENVSRRFEEGKMVTVEISSGDLGFGKNCCGSL